MINSNNLLKFTKSSHTVFSTHINLMYAAFDFAAIGMALVGLDGRWLRVNPALCEIVGYSAEELLNIDFQAITHPDDLGKDIGYVNQMLAGEIGSYTMEKRYWHKQGHIVWVKLMVSMALDDDGRPLFFVSQIHDISQDKRHQQSLQRHAQHLNEIITTQVLFANAQLDLDAFMTLVVERMQVITPATGAVIELVEGDEMVYRAASGSVAPYLGFRLKMGSSLSGLCVRSREVMCSVDTATDPRVNAQACQKVGAGSMVVAPLFKSGEAVGVLKVLAREAGVFGPDDVQTLQMMAGLLGAALAHQLLFDAKEALLAERTLALEALQLEINRRTRTEARTRRIIDSALDAFVCIDDDGVITDWNPQAEQTFGWRKDEVMGRRLEDILIPLSGRKAHFDDLALFRAMGQSAKLDRRMEATFKTRAHGEILVEMTISALEFQGDRHFNMFLHDITERKIAEERLQQMAKYDQLTGLPNRNLFHDRLNQASASCVRNREWMALMYLDIDYFKQVNDTLGHALGDALLQAFASRVKMAVRATDTLARLGGDEFTLIAENLHAPEEAELIARKIIGHMIDEFRLEDHVLQVSTSIGIALVHGEQIDPDMLIRMADGALYAAKNAGRNTFRFAEA